MQERFTGDEWELLKHLPFQVFALVANADGQIDDNELKAFAGQLAGASLVEDPLHREVLAAINQDQNTGRFVKSSLDRAATFESARLVKPLLQSKLGEAQYQKFMCSVFLNALEIAAASGGSGSAAGTMSASNVSDSERFALQIIRDIYDIDVRSLSG
jgi:hypothetical protein